MIYNVLISAVQQTHSIKHIYIPFHILFHSGLLQDIEYSSQCYAMGSSFLSLLYTYHSASGDSKLSVLPSPSP